jgi:hypothetical protein
MKLPHGPFTTSVNRFQFGPGERTKENLLWRRYIYRSRLAYVDVAESLVDLAGPLIRQYSVVASDLQQGAAVQEIGRLTVAQMANHACFLPRRVLH